MSVYVFIAIVVVSMFPIWLPIIWKMCDWVKNKLNKKDE